MVGLDWLDLDFFFHHFFQGSVPKFEFRPKMRTWILGSHQKCAPGGLGAAAAAALSIPLGHAWIIGGTAPAAVVVLRARRPNPPGGGGRLRAVGRAAGVPPRSDGTLRPETA